MHMLLYFFLSDRLYINLTCAPVAWRVQRSQLSTAGCEGDRRQALSLGGSIVQEHLEWTKRSQIEHRVTM